MIDTAKKLYLALILVFTLCFSAFGQNSVATIDAEAGPCSVEFTATDAHGQAVYGAQVQVHIEYGIFGLRRLDLQVGTDAHGRARFAGLPEDTDGALFFEASTEDLNGVAVYYPSWECHARHSLYMGTRR